MLLFDLKKSNQSEYCYKQPVSRKFSTNDFFLQSIQCLQWLQLWTLNDLHGILIQIALNIASKKRLH